MLTISWREIDVWRARYFQSSCIIWFIIYGKKWIYQCRCLIEYHTNLKNDKLGWPIKKPLFSCCAVSKLKPMTIITCSTAQSDVGCISFLRLRIGRWFSLVSVSSMVLKRSFTKRLEVVSFRQLRNTAQKSMNSFKTENVDISRCFFLLVLPLCGE